MDREHFSPPRIDKQMSSGALVSIPIIVVASTLCIPLKGICLQTALQVLSYHREISSSRVTALNVESEGHESAVAPHQEKVENQARMASSEPNPVLLIRSFISGSSRPWRRTSHRWRSSEYPSVVFPVQRFTGKSSIAVQRVPPSTHFSYLS